MKYEEYSDYLICNLNLKYMTGIQILSSMIVFQYYLHHAHWVVNGDDAYMFHLLYDRLYGSISGSIDEYAEYLVWSWDGSEIPHDMTGVEKNSMIKCAEWSNEMVLKDKMLEWAKVLETIAQMTWRDRTENKILDDISAIASTAKYLLWQITDLD